MMVRLEDVGSRYDVILAAAVQTTMYLNVSGYVESN